MASKDKFAREEAREALRLDVAPDMDRRDGRGAGEESRAGGVSGESRKHVKNV